MSNRSGGISNNSVWKFSTSPRTLNFPRNSSFHNLPWVSDGSGPTLKLSIISVCSERQKKLQPFVTSEANLNPPFKSTKPIPVYLKSSFRIVRMILSPARKNNYITYSMPCEACHVVNFQFLPSQHFKPMYSFGHLKCALKYMRRGFEMICVTQQAT